MKPPLPIKRSTWRVLLIGLLIRLFVMPFSIHSDLPHMYWNAHLIAYHQKFVFGLQTLLLYLHAGYLKLLAPILPPTDTLWIHQADNPFLNPFLSPGVVSTQGWFNFISHPQIYRTLFLLKLPYLFFDFACVLLLYRLGSDRGQSRLMVKFWWLNPILLFVTYIFGRHEVIALFFILLSIYLIKQEKQMWGLVALGVAIALRYYALFLLPFYALSMQAEWKKRLQWLGIGLSPWLIVNLIIWNTAGLAEVKSLINVPHDNYLLSMKFQIAAWDNLYIFPLLYFLLLLHRLYNREHGLRSLRQYSLIALLLLFATAYTGQSPQYWTWFLPLLVISAAEDHRLLPLHMAQVLCLAVYSFIGSRSTSGYLLASIAPDFFWSLPSPIEIISCFASSEMVISLARTAFSAVTLWMVYLVFRQMKITFPMDTGTDGAI